MNAFYWFVVIIAGYCALGVWVAHLWRAFHLKQYALTIAQLVLAPIAVLIAVHAQILGRLPIAIGLLGLGSLLLGKLFAPKEAIIPAREIRPTILQLVLISSSSVFLIPFVWLISTSLKTDAQFSAYPPIWIPHPALWSNYPRALSFLPPDSHDGLVMLGNTLIIAIMSVIGTVLSSSLVAYGFARVKWPGRDWVFGLVLATMMLPGAVTMMPQFLIFRQLHWIDTLFPLWVPSFFASAFNVFFLRQFFLGIPAELEDAARIDGCGYFRTWWNVMLPLVKPALAAVAITTFLGAWKDFMGPLIYISSPEKLTLAYGLQLYNSSHGGEPGYLMAATTMVIVPVMLLFFFTQRYFTQGIALSGFGGR